MNPQIFREYDIRGLVGVDLDEDTFRQLGKAYGTYAQELGVGSTVVVHDNRMSSPSFSAALIEGILSTGMDVFDGGEAPTPVMYYAVMHKRFARGG